MQLSTLRVFVDTLAWLKSEETELRWANTLWGGEWESDYSCLYAPSCSAGFPLWTLSWKKGNRRRGPYHNRKETTRVLSESQTFLNERGMSVTATLHHSFEPISQFGSGWGQFKCPTTSVCGCAIGFIVHKTLRLLSGENLLTLFNNPSL